MLNLLKTREPYIFWADKVVFFAQMSNIWRYQIQDKEDRWLGIKITYMCSSERRALDGACSYTRMGGADGWLGALQARGSSGRMREYQVDDPSSSRLSPGGWGVVDLLFIALYVKNLVLRLRWRWRSSCFIVLFSRRWKSSFFYTKRGGVNIWLIEF